MSLSTTLTSLCDLLRAHTGAPVALGRPDDKTSGIHVWPWCLEEDASFRNVRPASRAGGIPAPSPPAQSVHMLIFATPPLTPAALARLEQAGKVIRDHPVLDVEGVDARMALSNPGAEVLAEVFQAAGIPLTLCVSIQVRFTPKP